ncbi:hypothetical protein ABBQ32_011373 [Trebouxia sp. C0010 RCD-2024]
MRTLQELLDSVAADLDPSINYTAQLCSGGYRTPNSVKQADNAEQIQRACGLLLGDANIIWKAAGGFAGPPVTSAAPWETQRLRKLNIAVGLVGPPSNYAKDVERQAELANGTVFNCYRSGQRPVPLALMYPEFDDFCLRCASTACMTVRDSLFCLELCQKMQHFVSKEIKRELAFGSLFREYLQGQLSSNFSMTHQTRGKSIIDVQLQVKVANHLVTVVYIEVKREAGHSGDAQQEGMAFFLRDHAIEEFMSSWQTLRPALLLTVVGPSVRAFGMCVDATCTLVCEPLSSNIDMLLIPHLPQSFATLTRFFSAMPQLVQDLHDHYQHASISTKKLNFLGPHLEQLPYPLWDPEVWTDARQLGPAETHKLVYVATFQHKEQRISKFTKQYGWDVHRTWAKAGLAPELLESPSPIPGKWQHVQMEYLSSDVGWLTMRFLMMPVREQLKFAPEHFVLGPADMPELVQKAEQLLQTAHLVRVSGTCAAHGDARPDNIMVLIEAGKVKQVKLIDMDWAGTVGSTQYPTLLNTRSIVWPDGVGPGQALQQEHDLQLLQLQVNPATRAAANDWRAMFAHSVQVSEMEVDF